MAGTTLLPNGEQQFFDNNGDPLAGGLVYFFEPFTNINKDTWQDANSTILNSNPVVLDSAGRAIIYGSGVYRQIVKDSLSNLIWDQLTASTNMSGVWVGGQTTGSANAQVLSIPGYTLETGNLVLFTIGTTNTSATTLNIEGTGAIAVTKLSGGVQVPLVAGDWQAGAFNIVFYDGTQYQSIGTIGVTLPSNPLTNIASATTTDIGSTGSTNVQITGATTITSLGASANLARPLYFLKFAGALTLTYNATSLIIPGAANVTTAAGDTAFALYLGSGNWQIVEYTVAATSITGSASVLPGAIGLLIQNNVGTPNTKLDIATDYAVVVDPASAGAKAFSSVSKTIDFTVNGVNGLDTGAFAASTWYYIYLISNKVAVNALASLSATAPTLPAGYTLTFRAGAVISDGSTHLVPLVQKGNWTQYNSLISMGSGTIAVAPFVPPTATEMQVVFSSPNATITSFTNGLFVLTGGNHGIGGETGNFADTQSVRFLITGANVVASAGTALAAGWKDKVNAN